MLSRVPDGMAAPLITITSVPSGSVDGRTTGPRLTGAPGLERQKVPTVTRAGRPRPGEGLSDLLLRQLAVTDDRGHRAQARIPAGQVEVRELVLFVPHTLPTRRPADPLTGGENHGPFGRKN